MEIFIRADGRAASSGVLLGYKGESGTRTLTVHHPEYTGAAYYLRFLCPDGRKIIAQLPESGQYTVPPDILACEGEVEAQWEARLGDELIAKSSVWLMSVGAAISPENETPSLRETQNLLEELRSGIDGIPQAARATLEEMVQSGVISGVAGPQGQKGDKGEKGDAGPQGPAGPAGTAASPLAQFASNALPAYLRKVQSGIRPDSVVMTVVTDTHSSPDRDDRMQNWYALAEITKALGPTFCTHLGDVLSDATSGEATVATTDRYVDWMARTVKTLKGVEAPVFILDGNHDLGLYGNNARGAYVPPRRFTASAQQPFDELVKAKRNEKNKGTKEKPYGYRDFEEKKLRVIFLDSCDIPLFPNSTGGYITFEKYGWQHEQLSWMAEALDLTGKTDWGVIILSHISPTSQFCDASMPVNNGNLMKGLLDACADAGSFQGSVTGDFTSSVSADYTGRPKPRFILWMHGHTHADNITTPSDFKFRVVSFANALPVQNTGALVSGAVAPSPRTAGTLSSLCVTTCVYHPETGEMKTYRFGAGADYTVKLHEKPASPSALRTQGGFAMLPFGGGMTLLQFKEISLKFKVTSATPTPQYILQSYQAPGGMFDVQYHNGKLRYYLEAGLTGGTVAIAQNTVYTLRITFTASGGNTAAAFYITPEGGSETLDVQVTKPTFTLGGNFNILRNKGDSSQYFSGDFFSLKFTAASGAEYARYAFNEGSEFVTDLTGGGNDFALTGKYSWI